MNTYALQSVPVFAASALSLGLAFVVLRRGWQDRRHQLLALLLFFLAVSWGGFAMNASQWRPSQPASADAEFWLAYAYLWFPGLPLSVLALGLATRAGGAPAWTHPAVVCVAVAAMAVATVAGALSYGPDPIWGGHALSYFTWAATVANGVVPLVFLRRAWRARLESERESHFLLGVGIATTSAFHAAREVLNFLAVPEQRPLVPSAWGPALFFLAYGASVFAFGAALWVGSLRARGAFRKRLRIAALFITVQLLSGFAAAAARLEWFPIAIETSWRLALGLWAVGMLAGPAILAYAILFGRVQGLEARARQGVRRGTVASAFLAVFFVASEGAQQLFEGSAGPWVGLLAAGALVFVMAPLQRVADRVADAAIPPSSPPPTRSKEEAYRNALRVALRDRHLTREEEVHLMHLADELGVSARRALEIRHEVDAERSSDAPASTPA